MNLKDWAESFYFGRQWRKTRDEFLKSKNWMCERCGEAATIAHHKKWLTRNNINDVNVTLNWNNLEALCQDCHNKEHHRNDKKKRYAFDEAGNLVSLPYSLKD